eukprot:scaffold4384_cov180-Ochromonas_danica.AAC.5
MQEEGETIMANEYAIMALMVLVGINGHSLLPICAQTMYNLTACVNPFKGIERIIKLLLNTSLTGHDHSEILVKVLVNCSRYSWLRLRIIEEGGINQLHNLVTSLASREDKTIEMKEELIYFILIALRSLSESSGCRADMLQKGSIELLGNLLPFLATPTVEGSSGSGSGRGGGGGGGGGDLIGPGSNKRKIDTTTTTTTPQTLSEGKRKKRRRKCKLLMMKILHNFIHPPTTITNTAFEMAIYITAHIITTMKEEEDLDPDTLSVNTSKGSEGTSSVVGGGGGGGGVEGSSSSSDVTAIIQYCAACYHLFTKEGLRDALTQFFAISSAGNIFFNNLW